MSFGQPTRITWLGHSTFRLERPDGRVVLIDPWLSGNPKCPERFHEPERVDAILVSHGHPDHFADVPRLGRALETMVVCNFELSLYLEKQAGVPTERLMAMNFGGSVEPIPGLEVALVRADHSSSVVDDEGRLHPGGVAGGFVLRGHAIPTIYFAGDTGAFPEMMVIGEFHEPEVAILPIGGRFTMDPAAAAWAARMVKAKKVVPCHYGTFPELTGTPEALREALSAHGAESELIVVEPGEDLP